MGTTYNRTRQKKKRQFLRGHIRGSTELYHLEELAGKKFPGYDASTVAGLIASYLGRIPAPGEEFDFEGMRIQILDADRKRIRRMRIQLPASNLRPPTSDPPTH